MQQGNKDNHILTFTNSFTQGWKILLFYDNINVKTINMVFQAKNCCYKKWTNMGLKNSYQSVKSSWELHMVMCLRPVLYI